MAAVVSNVPVYSESQLEQVITGYIVQGFAVMNRTPTSATLYKKKEFSILWLVIGLILCVIPLIIYLIIYAGESDKMVQVYIVDQASLPSTGAAAAAATGQLSPDGRWRWTGTQWEPVAVPPPAQELPPPQAGPG